MINFLLVHFRCLRDSRPLQSLRSFFGIGLFVFGVCGVIIGASGCATSGPKPIGHLDTDQVEQTLLNYRPQLKACYEKDPARKEGLVRASIKIEEDGKVMSASVTMTTLGSPIVEACVTQLIRGIRFTAPDDGGVADVQYSFKFGPNMKTKPDVDGAAEGR